MGTLGGVARRIRALVAGVVVFAFAFVAALTISVRSARGGLDLIGHHSGPVVVSTANLYFALSDMDTQVVNVLLVGDRTDLGITRAQALESYERHRAEVNGYLQQTAGYAGDDPAASQDLRAVLNAFGRYQALAAQAILAQSLEPSAEAGRPPARALDLYRQATDVMHDELLPAAQRMIADEAAVVEHEYADARSSATFDAGWVMVFGLGLLGVLVALQILLARAHHRVFNPAIGVATLATLGVFAAGLWAMAGAEEQLRVAKVDAFDYAVMLHQARAISYDAYADQGRYLLDPSRRRQYETAFHDKSQQLLTLNAPNVAQYDAALEDALDTYFIAHRAVGFDGFLGRSLRHVAFPGELAAGENALRFYQTYQVTDRRLRTMVHNGDMVGAIRSYTGYALGGAQDTFKPYAGAIEQLIGINERGFTSAVKAGEDALAGWTWPPPLLAIAVVVLVFVGAAPRLAEYRA
jgi:CHASE3 domain sensor protein